MRVLETSYIILSNVSQTTRRTPIAFPMPLWSTGSRVYAETPVDSVAIVGITKYEELEDLVLSQWEQMAQNFNLYISDIAYIPYIHVLIAAAAQAILFGSLFYNGQNYPAVYLQYSQLATTLVQPAIINLRVATLAIGFTLILDLVVEGILSVRLSRFWKSSTGRAECTIRCMFVLSLLEPNIILLAIPHNPYTVVVAHATSTLQYIMLFSASMFVLSYAYDKTPRQCCRSLLLSVTFAFAQSMHFFVSMSGNPTAASFKVLSIISIALSALPVTIYFGISVSLLRSRWLKLSKTCKTPESRLMSSIDYIFVANFAAMVSLCLMDFISVMVTQKVYLFQFSTIDLVVFDVPIMLLALVAAIVPSWSARLESRKIQLLLSATKKSVKDTLMNPLLKISVGLNMLLANADLETQMDDKERQNLFHMALICNLAVSALDDIAMKDDHGSVHSESRSGSEAGSRKWSFEDVNHGMYDGNLRFGGTAIRHYYTDSRDYEPRLPEGKANSAVNSEAAMAVGDYDSEISEIQDCRQHRVLRKTKKGSVNYSMLSGTSDNRVLVRPSFNLLASSFQNSEAGEDPVRVCTSIRKPLADNHPSSTSRIVTSGVSEECHEIMGSVKKVTNPLLGDFSTVQSDLHSTSSIESSWVAFPSASSDVSDVVVDEMKEIVLEMTIPTRTHSLTQPPSMIIKNVSLSSVESDRDQCRTEGVGPIDMLSPDKCASSLLSIASSSIPITTTQCTPLQLYSFMWDGNSTGFECPFSIIEPTNQSLLNLLAKSQSIAQAASGYDCSVSATTTQTSQLLSTIAATQSKCPMVNQGNIPKKVFARCLSYLVNESFSSISAEENISSGFPLTATLHASQVSLPENCDLLSDFTWKLVEAFHSDLKSAFIVYEALLSTFSPVFNAPPLEVTVKGPTAFVSTHSIGTTSNICGEEGYRDDRSSKPTIFSRPIQLNYDSLCTLEEYLSGVLVLFVKASASLQVAADNVSVMKGRRRKGL